MVLAKPVSAGVVFVALLPVLLGGCTAALDSMVVFRDLADIPERPGVTEREVNDQAAESLEQDRARTAQAIEALRNEPFTLPEPAPKRPEP